MQQVVFLFVCLSLIGPSFATEKNPVPRFVSLRSKEVNARVGPGPNYPVGWVYKKVGLPVEVIAEFDTWRKIRDREGTEGWVRQNMLCGKRHGVIQEEEVFLYSRDDNASAPLVRLQQNVVVDLLKCRGDWCLVRINNYKGWVKRISLWGLYPKEPIG